MKSFWCILILVSVQVSASKNIYGDKVDHAEFDEHSRRETYSNKGTSKAIGYKDGYNNHHDTFERPCATYDLDCIRSYFAQNTGCLPVHGSHESYKDPIVKVITYHVPHANVSVQVNNAELKGLYDGKIKEFYINKHTDSLVLEVEFHSLIIDSARTVATYYFPGKEPIESQDITIVEFSNLSLTLTIQKFHDAKLARTHVYAYLPDRYPLLLAGAGIKKPKELVKNWTCKHIIGLSAREGMIQGAPIYMDLYLRNKICNFNTQLGMINHSF